jgi:hypothetical protein
MTEAYIYLVFCFGFGNYGTASDLIQGKDDIWVQRKEMFLNNSLLLLKKSGKAGIISYVDADFDITLAGFFLFL